jgi:hypothetical protein
MIAPVKSETTELLVPPVTAPVDAEVDVEVLKAVPKQFCIEDEKTANWLVRRIVAARQYGEHIKEYAEQERRRAEREEAVLTYLFGKQLERWVKATIEKNGGRRKSICLPAATLAFRKVNAALQVDDEEAVLVWAKSNCPAAVVLTERLSRSELKAHFEQTGEMPDRGAHIEPEQDRFSIR